MQALRLARSTALPIVARHRIRTLATAAVNVEVTSTTSQPASLSSSSPRPVSLSNIEAQWSKLNTEERIAVHEQLEALQLKDWKELTLEQKKAAYYVAFGPHGPRAPTSQPGDNLRVFLMTTGLVGVAGVLFMLTKYLSSGEPKTMSKEWQEASNERAQEMKLNPITGITSEGYSGKGFVQSK